MQKKHLFDPIYQEDSRILILGSFPSVKSLEEGFYYMNPTNRFWKVLGRLFGIDFLSYDIREKEKALKVLRIALFDVVRSCDIDKSADSKIRNAVPNDIPAIVAETDIQHIFINGRKAYELFNRSFPDLAGMSSLLPSTSAANAAWNLEKLIESWKVIKKPAFWE